MGFIVVLLAMYTAVLDRTREVGILKALGASPFYIVRIFLQEAVVLTLAGLLLGIALAYGAQSIIHNRFPLVAIQFLESHIGWAAVISRCGLDSGDGLPGASGGEVGCDRRAGLRVGRSLSKST